MKKVENIKRGDRLLFQETGFEYPVRLITEYAVMVNNFGQDLWIAKSLIEIRQCLLNTHGYRLYKLEPFPSWWIEKNNIH